MLLPEGRSFERTQELLQGAIDIHVHAGPHLFSSPRRVDPVEAAMQARDAGMQAIVFMDVFEMSNEVSFDFLVLRVRNVHDAVSRPLLNRELVCRRRVVLGDQLDEREVKPTYAPA